MRTEHSVSSVEQEVLAAETRRLIERGYTIYRQGNTFLPKTLREFQPDAVAIGREPKYLIEVVTEGADSAERLKRLHQEVKKLPDWELLVLFDRGVRSRVIEYVPLEYIDSALKSIRNVLSSAEAAPALLLAWGAFEALARRIVPSEFQRPQSPGRLIQILVSQGFVTIEDEALLRRLAKVRNSIIHGELMTVADKDDVRAFLAILESLRDQAAPPARAS
ncbi:MAG: hypothetical protein KF914_09870 [Rhizobiaceae bacterium]|nr:hypothetical protein [Rhizobiaceae bacterium]